MAQNHSGTVLYIEDNENSAYMLSHRLKRRGYSVEVAEDGKTGMHLALSLKPDIVLIDMNLPDMDGEALTKLMRSNKATATLPIIAVSSHVLPEDCDKALRAGCTDYVTKPIDFEQLLLKITDALQNRPEPIE